MDHPGADGSSAGGAGGAGKVPMAAAAVAPRAVVAVVLVPVVVAAAPPAGAAAKQALRRRWAQALGVLGCAAAALGFLVNSSSPLADSRGWLGSCAPTDAEAASLRAASELLLVFAAVQVLAATTALLVPAAPRQVAICLCFAGWQTGYRSAGVLLKLFSCHGRADAVVVTCYYIFEVVALVGYFVGSVIVNSGYY